MKRLFLAVVVFLLLAGTSHAQGMQYINSQSIGAANPTYCSFGQIFLNSSSNTLVWCSATDTWTTINVAGSAATLTTARTINGVSFNGSANITVTAATLTTTRSIYGNNFDGSAALGQVIASTYGGSGNGFFKVSGPTTSEKTFTLPDASSTILTSNAAVAVAQGGTSLATLTAHALYVGNGTSAPTALAVCGTGTYVRGVATADPICSTLILPNAATTGDRLIATSTNNYVSVAPMMTATITPVNQTGNATATFKMNGLGAAAAPCVFTPVATGRVVMTITGSIGNNTTADSATWKLAYNSGAIPANAAALTGNILGATGVFKALTGQLDAPFVAAGTASGLTLNTAYWFDLQIADITGGTATATAVSCFAYEV